MNSFQVALCRNLSSRACFDCLALLQVTQEFTAEAEKLAEANKERKTGVGELAKADEAKSFVTTGDRRQRSTPRA